MEFRKTDMPSFVAGLKAGQRNNGAGGLHVVPAVEHTMLHVALAKVEELETQLTAARNSAKQAAKRADVKLSGLFSKSSFIRRETGERWCSEKFEEGKNRRAREIISALDAMRNPDPAIVRAGQALAAAVERGVFADLLGETAPAVDLEVAAKARAAEIIAAGEKARAGGSNPLPPPTGQAAQIVAAGRRYRKLRGLDK